MTYALAEGELPAGVALTASGIEGQPTETGVFAFTVDAQCGEMTARGAFTLTVSAYFTVTFETNGGTPIGECRVMDGQRLPEIQLPQKENGRFLGWFQDADFIRPFSVETDVVVGDVTLYVRWLDAVLLTFETNGGEAVGAQYVYPQDTLTAVSAQRTGYWFVGWYRDAALQSPWDWQTDTVPAEDFTLFAKWQAKQYAVVFYDPMGQAAAFRTAYFGDPVTEPEPAAVEGYTFEGWYTDAAYTQKWDFSAPVTGNLALYARYVAAETPGGGGCGGAAFAALPAASLLLIAGCTMLFLYKRRTGIAGHRH